MLQFNLIATKTGISADAGVIYGVSVVCCGEAKGHGLKIDEKSLDTFLALASKHSNGLKVRFGNDHSAGVQDTTGTLKNFRKDGNLVRADLHLLKSDPNFSKILEMADKLPDEFGLSVVSKADEEKIGQDTFVRFRELYSADLVSNPAATNGLFFSQENTNHNNTMRKKFELALGLTPEAASKLSDDELCTQFESKCKLDAEAEAKKKMSKKKLDSDGEYEEKDEPKKFEAVVESLKTEFSTKLVELTAKVSGFEQKAAAAADSAKKAELENLKLEASRDGKVIPLADDALLKLDVATVKDMISKLPKGQVKLSRASAVTPKTSDGKEITDYRSPEWKQWIAQRRAEGALSLGQKMQSQLNLNQN